MLQTAVKAIRQPWKALDYAKRRAYEEYVFARHDHTTAYRKWMQYRINNHGPGQAVGGFDNDIGNLQFAFLCNEGLQPHHTLLDVGCGSLRGGEHFLRYLNPGCYTGMDISVEAINGGRRRLSRLVERKEPRFIVNDDLRFNERALLDEYDFALAQSVFTHLPPSDIEECLAHIGSVLSGPFYATFFDDGGSSRPSIYSYSTSHMRQLADEYGEAHVLAESLYPHPRGQRMLVVEY